MHIDCVSGVGFDVCPGGQLIAFAMLSPEYDFCWSVRAFNAHPLRRTSAVMRELFQLFAALIGSLGITALRSYVNKTKRFSMSFHARLGFLRSKI